MNSSFFGTVNIVTESSMQTINPSANNFAERSITYDANGNILGLQRFNNQSSSRYDNLAYQYNLSNNQLTSVTDSEPAGKVDYDIDSQPANNYTYNLRGQLTANAQENLTYTYNTQGLVTQVARNGNPLVKFYYNERGIRIKKESFLINDLSLQSTEYYVTDASGHVMSVYRKQLSLPIVQTEIPIFGDTRLGVFIRQDHSTHYEITDHLGNVRTVIKRSGLTNTPFIDQYADYYPFGEQLPLRNSMSNYRYAFQGQEKDSETGMEAFQLRLWDGRIGRWLTIDPYYAHHSPYLGMGNNPISDIDPDGGCPCSECPENCMGAGPDPLTDSDPMFPLTSGIQYLDEVVVTGSLNASGVSSDSWQRYVPVWGSGLDAYDAFSRGDWGWGIVHSALAISDVFLVKSLFTGIGKAVVRHGLKNGSKKYFGVGMSHSYSATVSRLQKLNVYTSNGKQFKHHWAISQELMQRYPRLLPLGNQTWNLKIFSSQASHMRWAHGQKYLGIKYPFAKALYPITSTPTWFRTGAIFGVRNTVRFTNE
ncbi:MAG: RHS repeat domain-containing protein [Flavobacterium sp.]